MNAVVAAVAALEGVEELARKGDVRKVWEGGDDHGEDGREAFFQAWPI